MPSMPWLTAHYDRVYVADFQYCDVPLVTFCKEQKISDLCLINNIQLITSPAAADCYAAMLQQNASCTAVRDLFITGK